MCPCWSVGKAQTSLCLVWPEAVGVIIGQRLGDTGQEPRTQTGVEDMGQGLGTQGRHWGMREVWRDCVSGRAEFRLGAQGSRRGAGWRGDLCHEMEAQAGVKWQLQGGWGQRPRLGTDGTPDVSCALETAGDGGAGALERQHVGPGGGSARAGRWPRTALWAWETQACGPRPPACGRWAERAGPDVVGNALQCGLRSPPRGDSPCLSIT